jgi:hypothetical protein
VIRVDALSAEPTGVALRFDFVNVTDSRQFKPGKMQTWIEHLGGMPATSNKSDAYRIHHSFSFQ